MDRRRFVFVGNRYCVLEQMFTLGLNIVKIYAVKGSYLESELNARRVECVILPSKTVFFEELCDLNFDILVSNGCPYIIPVSCISGGNKQFINIHPSLLPDMKGKSPINGALLYNRRHGVTCHYMSDEIDKGDIIEQIEIPLTDEVCLDLLYQVSFISEGIVFREAYRKKFNLKYKQPEGDYLYYSRDEKDTVLSEDDSIEALRRKIKAFCSKNQYAKLMIGDELFEIIDMVIIKNQYICDLYAESGDKKIILKYGENKILVRHKNSLLQFSLLGSNNKITSNTIF